MTHKLAKIPKNYAKIFKGKDDIALLRPGFNL